MEEEEPVLQGVAVDVPMEGLDEEEQLAIALKASVDTALEEEAARVGSFIYNRAPSYPFLFFFIFSFLFFFLLLS